MINTKTVLLFFIIIMSGFTTLSAQDSAIYFPTGMKWKEVIAEPHYLPLDTTRAATWEIGPDTTVNNLKYKQVVRDGKTINIWLREDAGKVWLLTEEYPREILLYNFNWIPDEVLYTEYIRETDNGMEVFKDEFTVDDYKTTTCGNHSYEYIFGRDHTTIRGMGRVADLNKNSGLLGYSKMKTILPGLLFFKVLWIVRDNKEVFRSEIAEEWTFEIPATALADVEINETNFPDENFRKWLLTHFYYSADSLLTESEIANIKFVYVSEKGIKNLKGIEYLTGMTYLECNNNQLTELDITKNKALAYVDCSHNQLTSIKASGSLVLEELKCSDNLLTSLDMSKCRELEGLYCERNQLTALNVSECEEMQRIYCDNNQLTTLDVTGCPAMEHLYISSNQLTAIDLSKNDKLVTLDCSDNQLTSLDISMNRNIYWLAFNQNRIAGAEMDALLESLPTVSNHNTMNVLSVENEQNVMTKTQVAAAQAKGWTPLYYDGSKWQEYEGSTPTDIGSISNLEVVNHSEGAAVYDLQGRSLPDKMERGIYIRDGKKIAVK